MGIPEWGTPRQLLMKGSTTYTLPDKVRFYAIRRIAYDDTMTPLYAQPYPFEMQFEDLQKLYETKKVSVLLQEAPILDLDHSLKVYNHDEVCTE